MYVTCKNAIISFRRKKNIIFVIESKGEKSENNIWHHINIKRGKGSEKIDCEFGCKSSRVKRRRRKEKQVQTKARQRRKARKKEQGVASLARDHHIHQFRCMTGKSNKSKIEKGQNKKRESKHQEREEGETRNKVHSLLVQVKQKGRIPSVSWM